MSLLRAIVTHNLRPAMRGEVRAVAGALKRAVAKAGADVQAALRAQARGAGFRDGGRSVANAWRLAVYPRPNVGPDSFKPAAVVWSKMPTVVEAHDRGALIVARSGRYLAVPTPVNVVSRGRGRPVRLRVTPQEMFRARAFVRPSANPRVRLWCLRLRTETSKRGRVRLYAGRYAEVFTGRVKGLQERRRAYAAERTFVPLFFLMKSVRLRKRLDVAAIRRTAPGLFARHARAELGALAPAFTRRLA